MAEEKRGEQRKGVEKTRVKERRGEQSIRIA